MLIAMVSIFVCCWLPLNVIIVTNDYYSQLQYEWPYFLLTFFSAHVVAMSSTVYNPFLYGGPPRIKFNTHPCARRSSNEMSTESY